MSIPTRIGRYSVIEELGRGAMGVVYRAVDPALDRPVAIKVIAARTSAVPVPAQELEARFLREARVAARITHPGVVMIYDAGREGDSLYLVMELIQGESLAERLARQQFPSPAEALEYVAQAAQALAAAHALGVIHRDVKPGNIMMTLDGKVKVTDFGVAKAMGEDTNLTRTGTVVGSPAYMAPEQVRGESLDGRSDLFSLGVVLYELLLRRKPFPSDTVTTLIYQILHEDPLADVEITRGLGPEISQFLGWCLAKSPADRVPDGQTMATYARQLIPHIPAAAPLGLINVNATSPTAGMRIPTAVEMAAPRVGGGYTAPPPTPTVMPSQVPPPHPSKHSTEKIIIFLGLALLLVAGTIAILKLRPGGDKSAMLEPTPTPTPQPAVTPVVITPGVAPATPTPTVTPTPTRQAMYFPTATPNTNDVVPTEVIPPTAVPSSATEPPVETVFECRKGAEFNVDPEDAIVEVDGQVIGKADDWDGKGGGKVYIFNGPGVHYARLTLKGYRTAWVKIIVKSDAKRENADVDTELKEVD